MRKSLALAAALLAGPALRGSRAHGAPSGSTKTEPSSAGGAAAEATKVVELRYIQLRGEDGSITPSILEDAVLGLLQNYTGDYPLDALSSLFSGDPPVSVLVDARSGNKGTTPVLAMSLATALRDMGSQAESIVVSDASDADLVAGGYRIVRDGEGPFCHGDAPKPGYGEARELPGVGKGIRFSRALDEKARRIAVLARLHAREGRMGPFVLDAALRALDESTRKKAFQDPEFGARILASPPLGGRVNLVIGELFELDLGPADGAGATGGAAPASRDAKSDAIPSGEAAVWKADELLGGRNLFAVERIGHTILSNTMKARGRATVPEPPLLAAAAALGVSGAKISSIGWRKARV